MSAGLEDVLRLAVSAARSASMRESDPQAGDLVVEVTTLRREEDPDAIGELLGHDLAPWGEDDPLDGSVPMREVWDVRPLNPRAKTQTIDGQRLQRWENATFRRVPDRLAASIRRAVWPLLPPRVAPPPRRTPAMVLRHIAVVLATGDPAPEFVESVWRRLDVRGCGGEADAARAMGWHYGGPGDHLRKAMALLEMDGALEWYAGRWRILRRPKNAAVPRHLRGPEAGALLR